MASRTAGRFNPAAAGKTSSILPKTTTPKTSDVNLNADPYLTALGTGSSGSGAGGSGSGGSYNLGGTGGTQTAFGKPIQPGSYEEIQNNPDMLVREFFRQNNVPTDTGAYANAQAHAQDLPLLWMLMQDKGAAQGTGNLIDWTGQYLGSQFKSGGPALGPADIVHSILNASSDPNSIVKNYLDNSGLTATDQVGNLISTLSAAFKDTAMPDIVRAAIVSRLNSMGQDYQDASIRDPQKQSFLNSSQDYLKSIFGG